MTDLVLQNLSKQYGPRQALRGFSGRLPAGKTTVLMGPSGCGKTTLLRILAGLTMADGGTAQGLAGLRVSMVFQEDRLCPGLSALANVSMVCPQPRAGLQAALLALGLDETAQKSPARALSGGQARRVALARALWYPADLYLLDEPFKGLDEETRLCVLAETRRLLMGRTALVVTHEEADADALGAELLRMG